MVIHKYTVDIDVSSRMMELLVFGTLALDHQTMILYSSKGHTFQLHSITIHDSATFDTQTNNYIHICIYIYKICINICIWVK